MSSITLEHVITVSEVRPKLGWTLLTTATDADATNGVDDDPNIFVMNTGIRTPVDVEVLSHVADLHDMNNIPGSKSEVPPKTQGYYRSSILKLFFKNKAEADEAVVFINQDAKILMDLASDTSGESSTVVIEGSA